MSLKIVFMGTPEFSVESKKALNNSRHQILSIFTQPSQKKKERSKNITITCPVNSRET